MHTQGVTLFIKRDRHTYPMRSESDELLQSVFSIQTESGSDFSYFSYVYYTSEGSEKELSRNRKIKNNIRCYRYSRVVLPVLAMTLKEVQYSTHSRPTYSSYHWLYSGPVRRSVGNDRLSLKSVTVLVIQNILTRLISRLTITDRLVLFFLMAVSWFAGVVFESQILLIDKLIAMNIYLDPVKG